MLVSRTNFDSILFEISREFYIGLDTETYGLFPFHGDSLFSTILTTKKAPYYFNFKEYPGVPEDLVLPRECLQEMQERLYKDPNHYWFIHDAIYDQPILLQDKLFLAGEIHCTKTNARVQYNEHFKYDLDSCGARIKVRKDATVANYITKNKLKQYRDINGYKVEHKRYDLVPFPMMVEYGEKDGIAGYKLGMHQIEKIGERAVRQPNNKRNLITVMKNENRLQKTLYRMQVPGARVDREYCKEAVELQQYEIDKSMEEFKRLSGRDFLVSGKLFAEVFEDQKHKWKYTAKGNPSFDSDTLERFDGPLAEQVQRFKKAKATIDFFHNFLKFADRNGDIHTRFNAGGTRTGRFSSSDPNLQNLKKDKGEALKEKYVVRRAFVPREGYFFAMLDYDQIEYRMFADYANCKELIEKVLGGLDVHTATAEVAKCDRDQAKTVNFLTLYGGGIKKLAEGLGTTENVARTIQNSIFDAAPELRSLIRQVIRTAENRGHIYNWLGRVCYFPKRNLCYKAPNTLFQGGAGDVVKVAMNSVDEFLLPHKTRMLLNIHDELVFEVAYGEEYLLPEIKTLMEKAYPYLHLPLTVGIDYSEKSLADKEPWDGEKAGNKIQGEDLPTAKVTPQFMGREDTASGHQGHP